MRLIKKDLQIIFSGKQFIIFLVAYIPLLLFLLGDSESQYSLMMIIVTYAYMATTTLFSYEITGKPHLFIQSLPVTKSEIVISRYLLVFINFIIAIIIATIYLWGIGLLGLKATQYFNFGIVKLTLPVLMAMVSFSFPAFYQLPAKIANAVSVFIYIIGINLVITQKEFVETVVTNFMLGQTNGFVFLLVSTILMIISMAVSIYLYQNKDLA